MQSGQVLGKVGCEYLLLANVGIFNVCSTWVISAIYSQFPVPIMISSVMLMTVIVSFLAICCFGGGASFNPKKKEETKKSPEQKFGEALTEYIQYLKYLEPKKEEAKK